jgi:hypothetical protein
MEKIRRANIRKSMTLGDEMRAASWYTNGSERVLFWQEDDVGGTLDASMAEGAVRSGEDQAQGSLPILELKLEL